VRGDAATVERVRVTARELLSRLGVQPRVKLIDEPEANEPVPPLVVAYLDLSRVASPSIDIEEGRTRRELTRRQLTSMTTVETGVESLLHVLYLTVESSLQLAPRSAPPASVPVAPAPSREQQTTRWGFDVGPILRVSSLGGSRIVPGGGLVLEPRAEVAGNQLGLAVSAALHAGTELSFARGEATARSLQLRVVPTFDALLSEEVSGCVGLGGGVDSLLVEPVQAPDQGTAQGARGVLDPVLSALLGARVPISGRAFLSALGTLDYDLQPTTFVARDGPVSRPVLALPRLRAGVTIALSFTAAGPRRFPSPGAER